MTISIIILTKNAGDVFKSVLDGIFTQNIKFLEVIIVDSGSKDNTLKIAKEYPVKIIEIQPEEFGHGITRNFGASLAKGNHIVYLTQDAIPNDINWLKELMEPFKDSNIAGVYGRQIPKKDENIIDKFFYLSLYSDKDIMWKNHKNLGVDTIFSDVNSAIRKDILLKYPFDNDIIVSEDHEWAHRVLKEDYAIFYNSKASVVHSHSYNLKNAFKRHFDIGVSYNKISIVGTTYRFIKKGIQSHLREQSFIIKNGYFYLVSYCIIKDIFKLMAFMLGKNERLLPKVVKAKLSNYERYWI